MRKLMLTSIILATLTILIALLSASGRLSTAYSLSKADTVSAIGHAEVGLDNVYQSSIDSSDFGITVTVNISGSQRALLIACYSNGQCFRSAAAFVYAPVVINPPGPTLTPMPTMTSEPYSQK